MMRSGLAALTLACTMFTAGVAAAQSSWPVDFPPRPLPARDVKFPPYEIRTLPNGLQVVAVLHHEQPVVTMRLIVRAGSASDPQNKLGVARLVASLLDQGTTTQSAQQLNDNIDFIGAAIGTGAYPDLSFVNMVVMKDSFDVGLRTLSDVVRNPAFAQEEIERQRQQMISALQVNFQDPEFLAEAVFHRLVYGFHPYGMPETGTPDTLAAVTRNDLLAFHRQNFVPNNAILAVVGDVTAEEAFGGVSRAFGDWERRAVTVPSATAPPAPTRRVVAVNKSDAVQTEVRIGHVGVPRNHPDYMPLNLAIRILGGEGANRLHQVLRTDRGLTYGAQADMETFRDSGDFEAETNTRTAATGEVVRLMLEQFVKLQRERVGERELADAKAYMTGNFPLTIETPDAIAMQVLNVVFYGLPVGELQSFRERVDAVTVADIERVARRYLQPDRLSIVLVGDATAFVPQLRDAGIGAVETVEMNDLDLMTPTFTKAGRAGRSGATGRVGAIRPWSAPTAAYWQTPAVQRPAAPSGAATAPQVARKDEGLTSRVLIERAIEAKGGLERLRGVKAIRAETNGVAYPAAGVNAPPMKVDATTYLEYPNRMRVETKLPEGTRIEVYDGTRGWVRDGGTVREVPAEMLRVLELTFKRDTIAMLLAAYDGTMAARRLPDIKDDEGRIYHALEISSTTLEPTVLYLDPATFLLAKQVYVAGGPNKPLVEERFSEYKPSDGLNVAFTARVRVAGREVFERRLVRIEINPPTNPRLFTRPTP